MHLTTKLIWTPKLDLSCWIWCFFFKWDAKRKLQSIISNLKLLNLVAFHWRFLQSRKAYLFTAQYDIESRSSAQSNSGYLRSTQSAQYSHAEMERGRKKVQYSAFANNFLLTQEAIICITTWILNPWFYARRDQTGSLL